jgi:hypothetical protein
MTCCSWHRRRPRFLSWNHSLAAWPWTSLDTDLRLRRQLGTAIGSFHAVAIGPRWAQVRSFLSADLARQIRRLATGDIDEFLASLCPQLIQWRPPKLQIHASGPGWPEFDLAGRGLVIMPTVFHGPGASVSYDLANCDGPTALIYPAARDLTAAAELWTGARRRRARGAARPDPQHGPPGDRRGMRDGRAGAPGRDLARRGQPACDRAAACGPDHYPSGRQRRPA